VESIRTILVCSMAVLLIDVDLIVRSGVVEVKALWRSARAVLGVRSAAGALLGVTVALVMSCCIAQDGIEVVSSYELENMSFEINHHRCAHRFNSRPPHLSFQTAAVGQLALPRGQNGAKQPSRVAACDSSCFHSTSPSPFAFTSYESLSLIQTSVWITHTWITATWTTGCPAWATAAVTNAT
jgi:hypothetical protein